MSMKKTFKPRGKKPEPKPDVDFSRVPPSVVTLVTGRSQRYLRELAVDSRIPGPVDGAWDLCGVVKALLAMASDKVSDVAERKKVATMLRAEELARREKLETDRLDGALVDVEEARRLFAKCAGEVKTRLMAIPAKAAPLLEGKSVVERQEVLTVEIVDALTQLQRLRMNNKQKDDSR